MKNELKIKINTNLFTSKQLFRHSTAACVCVCMLVEWGNGKLNNRLLDHNFGMFDHNQSFLFLNIGYKTPVSEIFCHTLFFEGIIQISSHVLLTLNVD